MLKCYQNLVMLTTVLCAFSRNTVQASGSTHIVLEVQPGTWAYKSPVNTTISLSFATTSYQQKLGRAALWIRGSSAQLHPKKSYRLEFRDENGADLKTAFLGMPAESDWILYPAYRDKTFVRDILAYDLWRE